MDNHSHSHATSLTALVLIICSIWFFIKMVQSSKTGKRNKINLPPSPPKLPIIGHLHQVGRFPHRSLFSLSQKYGPLMLLYLGSKPAVVVSTADTAKEIFKTQDLSFSNRGVLKSFKRVFYDGKGVILSPYGDEWKKLRTILVNHLLHNGKVKTFKSIIEDEIDILIQKLKLSCLDSSPVNLTDLFVLLTSNTSRRAAFGKKLIETKRIENYHAGLIAGAGAIQRFTVGELIPWLSWIDKLNGFNMAVDRLMKTRDVEINDILEGDTVSGESMRDILIEMYRGDKTAATTIEDKDEIKALLLDVLAAGVETLATALGWTMAELIRHPVVMRKLQDEVRGILGRKQDITKEDMEKMHYLKAVIKEIFRCHPPIPAYLRESREDVNLKGYDIPSGTLVIINVWAINHDPNYWDEPEKFKPERFLRSPTDFKGFDFQFLPFGAGRRICPGISFSTTTIERVLANLMHKFDWGLPNGAEGKDLDMSERSGLTVALKNPLIVVPKNCYC
uniref:Cytochrome P450 n=1 Tax=Scoparia dulcis TaxID=107240 RepID=A0A7G1L4T6_SCODU|nr:cytochrome P450 [Scoparia dulcis]